MSKTPEQLSQEAAERIKLASAQASAQVSAGAAAAVPAVSAQQANDLEDAVRRVLAQQKAEKAAAKPKEPNWATLSETDALNTESPMYIPVIEHEIPAYLDMKLEDPEYLPVWVNRNQVRVSSKKAEGLELLRPEHVAKNFTPPLPFDSEGNYIYQDVICMRGHKRIILGRRRKYVEMSTGVLKGAAAKERAKKRLEDSIISNDSELDHAFSNGSMSFYN